VPDKHTQHKSKYTADRMIPGAFEGETVTRRRFMTGTAHTAGAIAAASFALPALGFAGVGNVHVGRLVELDVEDPEQLRPMCEKLLANPLVEDYEIELLDSGG